MEPVKTTQKLDGRYAYIYRNGGSPIRTPKQMLPDKTIQYDPLDKEWKRERDKKMWWATGYTGTDGPPPGDKIWTLRDKLLSFGGFDACLPIVEEDINEILQRGQFWYGDKSKLMRGEPNRCHSNSCNLWEQNRNLHEVAIATGYALSEDGMWRQHSWLMHRKARSVTVIETTALRVAYFGFVMTDEEAEKFCYDNPF